VKFSQDFAFADSHISDTKYESKSQEQDDFKRLTIEASKGPDLKRAHISLWDFAGQEDFYATHHVFLSPDGVFVVVCNAEKCLQGDEACVKSESGKVFLH